jgi:RecB family exonuclease
MAGTILITTTPNDAVRSHLEGRRLITRGSLPALTWQVDPCTLEALISEHPQRMVITDTEALKLLAELIYERKDLPFRLATPPLLDAVRTVAHAWSLASEAAEGLRASPIISLSRAYLGLLAGRGMTDPALPSLPDDTPTQPLVVHGYTSLTVLQAELLTRLADEDSLFILPDVPGGSGDGHLHTLLSALGWRTSAQSATSTLQPPAQVQVMLAADPLHEARAALTLAAEYRAARGTPVRVILTARTPETYRTALTIAARERQLPLHWHAAQTHAETPPGRLLYLVAQVLMSGWTYESVCALLSSPTLGELAPGHWQNIRRAGPGSQEHWNASGLLPQGLAFLGDLPARAMPDEWFQALRDLPLALNLLFELSLPLASRLPEASDQRTYGAALHQALRLPTPCPATLPEDALVVVPADALPGAQADLVLALGLTEGVWPALPSFPPPLDAHARAELNQAGLPLPDVVSHARHERDLYRWAQCAAPRFVAFTPQVVRGSRRVPSDLIRNEPLISAPPYHLAEIDPPEVPVQRPFDHPPFDVFDLRLSPTQLTRFGQCAFRWFAQHGLGLRDPEEPRTTLAPHVRGRLYHLTLDHLAKHLKDDPAADRQRVMENGFVLAETQEHLARLPNWAWQRTEHLRHLSDLVASPEFLPAGHTVHASEQDFALEWYGLTVHGTLDRLDLTPEGYEITDYKTGTTKPKGAKGADGRLSLDVQLPVYLAAATELMREDVTRGRYLSLTRRDRRPLAVAAPDQLALKQLADELFDAVETGHFPVNPDAAMSACEQCAYVALCRHTGEGGAEDVE